MGNKKNHARKNKRLANNWRKIIKTRFNCIQRMRVIFAYSINHRKKKTSNKERQAKQDQGTDVVEVNHENENVNTSIESTCEPTSDWTNTESQVSFTLFETF